jgi:hypothetical protein
VIPKGCGARFGGAGPSAGGSIMRGLLIVSILAFAVVVARAQGARGEPGACQDALDAFQAAQDDVEDAKQNYNNCDSDGSEDCSTEFEALKSAQEDLEGATADYQSECP